MLDVNEVKSAARGNWARTLNNVARIGDEFLTPRHGPCPKCGGTDRFRTHNDFTATGGCICGQCGRELADGVAVVMWMRDIKLPEALELIAEHLGNNFTDHKRTNGTTKFTAAAPREFEEIKSHAEDIKRIPWSLFQVQLWCAGKQPITPEGLIATDAYLAMYRDKHRVIVIPCRRNFLLFALNGKPLPAGKDASGKTEYVKVKTINKFTGWAGTNGTEAIS